MVFVSRGRVGWKRASLILTLAFCVLGSAIYVKAAPSVYCHSSGGASPPAKLWSDSGQVEIAKLPKLKLPRINVTDAPLLSAVGFLLIRSRLGMWPSIPPALPNIIAIPEHWVRPPPAL